MEFVKPTLRPLPVILLLDTSGSMYGESIDTLNVAVKRMIESFKKEESTQAEIYTSVITFGGRANVYLPFTKAQDIEWVNLEANGGTPFGGALRLCKELIMNLNSVELGGKPYKPTIVLVSDGNPTDEYTVMLDDFINTKRTGTCDRWALGIGDHADYAMLEKFLSGQEKRVMEASDAAGISKFFQIVTNSTKVRTTSTNPNAVPEVSADNLGDFLHGDIIMTKEKPQVKPVTVSNAVPQHEEQDENDESPFTF
ncbi:vWA domain-containing protein [Candidatus Kurthia intestinigallinarum]|uniref:vWA domain-containing protein n=1 Tax=Candidatus Kurthia intestinigallinarum TaxID=1562256 RepID=UPI001315190B|nr:VWA domain-containing protein [Kurthia sp. 3B1D]